jgi:hypothetical protein
MPDTGPHLQIALFCEKVLEEGDGTLSLIRVIDRITQTASGPDAPEQMPPFLTENLTLVIALKGGRARGRHAIKIRPETPTGMHLPTLEQGIQIQPGNAGVNLIMPLTLPVSEEGVIWFDIFLAGPPPQEDVLLTRAPLEIQYLPQRIGGS